MIDTLLEIYNLKDEKRTGWQLRNIEEPESVAAHSWGTAFLSLNYAPGNLDTEKILKLAIAHDVAEAEIGDIAKRAVDAEAEFSEEEKEKLERKAVNRYSQELGKQFLELWKEYEGRETEEAKFVKDMDLINMCPQTLKYEKQKRYNPDEQNENFQQYDNLDEFFATIKPRLNTDRGNKLFSEIKERYEEAKSS